MSEIPERPAELELLRPKLLALLELHRASQTPDARGAVVALLERTFLDAALSVAQDLVEHGWTPPAVVPPVQRAQPWLRVVGGTDAA
jgi:hypothetical protein